MKPNRKVASIIAASALALGALGYVGAAALAQGATPIPAPTLNEPVAANTAA